MSECVPSLHKSYADFGRICRYCRKQFTPLNYKQRYCLNSECKTIRYRVYQRTYRQRKNGGNLPTFPQSEKELPK